jgi:signal transduction histidine kinase
MDQTKILEEQLVPPSQIKPNLSQTRFEYLARENQDIAGLYNLAVALGSNLNLVEMIWTLYKEASRLLNTTNFAIAIYDPPADQLNFELIFNRGQRIKPRSIKLASNRGLAGRVLREQAPLLIRDLQAAGLTDSSQAQPDKQIRSWLGAPILNPRLPQPQAQGIVAIWSYEPNVFTERDLWLLSAISTQAAIALRNVRLYETILDERDRIVEVEKQARQALARDLHDGPTQLVSAIMLHLDLLKLVLEKEPHNLLAEISATQTLAQHAIEQIRKLLFELRPLPLEMQGLAAALQVFLEHRQKDVIGMTNLTFSVKGDKPGDEISRQEEKIESAIFAIVQEAVNNALKHAQARNINVELGETDMIIYARVEDDGQGFEVDKVMRNYEQRGSLGMINLHERAELIGGELNLISTPGEGTKLNLKVPKSETARKKTRAGTGPLSPLFKLMTEK